MAKAKPTEVPAGWTRTDTMILGIAAAIGLVAALIAHFGGQPRVQALVGLALLFSIAYVMSSARRAITSAGFARRPSAWAASSRTCCSSRK